MEIIKELFVEWKLDVWANVLEYKYYTDEDEFHWIDGYIGWIS